MSHISDPLTPKLMKTITSPLLVAEKSPKIRMPGTSQNSFQHVCSFISNIQQWLELQNKGIAVCQAIEDLRLYELIGHEYPSQLKPLCDSLTEAVESMATLLESMDVIKRQCDALAKLESSEEPIFNTWPAHKVATEISKLYLMFVQESEIKTTVKENIAHSRDRCLTVVYVSAWEYNTHVDDLTLHAFITEIDSI